MRVVWAIAVKDLLLLWRDRIGFFWWMVGFPLLIAVFTGAMFAGIIDGRSRSIGLALVNEAATKDADAYVDLLEELTFVDIEHLPATEAEEAVRRGRLDAVLFVQDGFALTPGLLTGQSLPLVLKVDPSRAAESAYLQGYLKETAFRLARTRWFDRFNVAGGQMTGGAQPQYAETATIPVVALDVDRKRPRSSFEICFPIGILWGMLGLTAQFATSIVREREVGTLLRLRVAPISRGQHLAGHGLAFFIASMGVILLLLAVGRVAFGVRWSNPAVVLVAMVCTGLCFVGLCMMLSVLGKTQAAVGGGTWATLLVLSMVGGGMVPRMFMPAWMETASHVSPVKWAIFSLEAGIWRGLDLFDVLLPAAVLVGQGLLCGLIGVRVLAKVNV